MLRSLALICFRSFFLIFVCIGISSLSNAEQKSESTVLRVGGKYSVKSIQREDKNNFFTIKFVSETPTGKFDELSLECDHVHFALKEGLVLKIAGDVFKVGGNSAELSQVLLFLPHIQGYSPVWLLSRHSANSDFAAGKYLEMHAPQSDYQIL